MEVKESLKQAAEKIVTLKQKIERLERQQAEPIAIVGMGCRFPDGANSPEDYWQLLSEGRDPIKELVPERWMADDIPAEITQKFPGTRWGGLINKVDMFDAEFFGIAPIEAKTLDPQQRILLEVSWEALENAGIPPTDLMGSRTSVFIGMASLDYRQRVVSQPLNKMDIYATTGNNLCTASGRLSYFLGLEGSSLTIETACSSSLVAVSQACRSLQQKDSDLALAGGVNLILSPLSMSLLAHTEALSPDGRCKSFDSRANGFVRSEGCGIIILKRLSDAQRDGDNVLAVIRGVAVNQDGCSTGLTTPNVLSQQRLLTEALHNANVKAEEIGYIEAHGTGTPVGDPIEFEAINAVIGLSRKNNTPCILGSVKSNIGHLEAAAGIAGLIKTVLVLQNEKIPAPLHYKTLNPRINARHNHFLIPNETINWPRSSSRRIAGVSSFGLSGTNAHVIVEEASQQPQLNTKLTSDPVIIFISARSLTSLMALTKKYSESLMEGGTLNQVPLVDIAYSAALKRSHHDIRLAVIGYSHSELSQKLLLFYKKIMQENFSDSNLNTFKDFVLAELNNNQTESTTLLNKVGRLYCQGEPVDFSTVVASSGNLAPLPTYAWRHESFWIENTPSNHSLFSDGETLEKIREPDDLYLLIKRMVATLLELEEERVRTDRHLFEIGFDSLSALNLVNQLQNDLSIQITVADLLREGCIDNLILWINAEMESEYSNNQTKIADADELDFTFIDALSNKDAMALANVLFNKPVDVGVHQAIKNYLKGNKKSFTLYPVSHGQSAMYFVYRLAPKAVGYNVMCAARISSEISFKSLELSVSWLVQKHTSLKTTFFEAGSQIYQKVITENHYDFQVIDASSLTEDKIQESLSRFGHMPYDLKSGPIFRVAIFSKQKNEHYLVIGMHHIICDAGSMAILLYDLQNFYESAVNQVEPNLDGAIPFNNFVKWERAWLKSSSSVLAHKYWSQQLAFPPPRIDLGYLAQAGRHETSSTFTPKRHSHFNFEGEEFFYKFDKETTQALRVFAKQEGVTLYNVLLAGYFTLINKLTGIQDIAVGAYANLRQQSEFENQVGYYVNTLILRAKIDDTSILRDVLLQVKDVLINGLSHQNYPLSMLAEELKPPREPGRQLWFDHVFNWTSGKDYQKSNSFFMNALPKNDVSTLLPLQPWEIHRQVTQFDLALNMGESDGEIFGAIVYNSSLFNKEMVATLMLRYRNLLLQIIKQPQNSIRQLSLLEDNEKKIIVDDWNKNQSTYDASITIHERFVAQAQRTPDAIALYSGGSQMSYSELDERSTQLAQSLINEGVAQGTSVGICTERSPVMIVGLLAILKTGAHYVPLDPIYPKDRNDYMLDDSGAALLISTPKISETSYRSNIKTLLIHEDFSVNIIGKNNTSVSMPKANNAAYLIYTSGSTGRPKGILVGHQSCAALFHWADLTFSDDEVTGILGSTSICFDISVFEIFYPLCRGGAIVLVQDALHYPDDPNIDRVSLINTVPSVLSAVLQFSSLPKNVQTITLVGEPLRRKLVDRLYSFKQVQKVYNLYGPTEDTVFSTVLLVPRNEVKDPSIGKPIQNTVAYILDAELKPLPPYARGELYLGGAGLALGYHDRSELNKERFLKNPFPFESVPIIYSTGDIASYLPNGEMEFYGRIDNQIKLRGYRIELGEIESVINQLDEVVEATIVMRPIHTESAEQELIAYVVSDALEVKANAELNMVLQKEIMIKLEKSLPNYMLPAVVVFMQVLPKTLNGKIDRKALPNPPSEKRQVTLQHEMTPLQYELAEIWGEILNINPQSINVHDKFYELGGSSLRIVQMVAHIKEKLNRTIEVADLFRFQDIFSISQWLDGEEGSHQAISEGIKKGNSRRSAIQDVLIKRQKKTNLEIS